jgi:hypothetical protein
MLPLADVSRETSSLGDFRILGESMDAFDELGNECQVFRLGLTKIHWPTIFFARKGFPGGMFHVKHFLISELCKESVSRETLVINGYLRTSRAA